MHYPSYVLIFQIFFIIQNMGSTCTPLNSDLKPVHVLPLISPYFLKVIFTVLADSVKLLVVHVLPLIFPFIRRLFQNLDFG